MPNDFADLDVREHPMESAGLWLSGGALLLVWTALALLLTTA